MYNYFTPEFAIMSKQASWPSYISSTDQFIIDAIRTIRLNLNLSQNALSEKIREYISLVSTIESITGRHKYTDSQLHEIAHAFTEEAQKIKSQFPTAEQATNFQTEYTVYDFYPNEPLPDVLVVKSRNVIINKVYPTGAVRYILEDTDFLSVPRTNKEVTEEANRLFSKTWKTTDFGMPLDRATAKGDLVKTDPPAVVTYQKSPKKPNAAQ